MNWVSGKAEESRLTLGHPALMAGWLVGLSPKPGGYRRENRLGRGKQEKAKCFEVGIGSVTGLRDTRRDDSEGAESVIQEKDYSEQLSGR